MIRLVQAIAFATLVTHACVICHAQEPKRWIGDIGFGNDSGLVVAESARPNVYVAYSKLTGEWTTYTFPPDCTVTPIVGGGDTIAMRITGRSISKLVAVDRNGKWQEKELGKTVDLTIDSLYLAVTKNVAVYQIAGTSYAFSGISGKWDAITDDVKPKVSNDIAMIVAPNRIKVFSAQTGMWSESPELATGN